MNKPQPYRPERPVETAEDKAIWEQMRIDAIKADEAGEKLDDFLGKSYEVQKKTSQEKVSEDSKSDSPELEEKKEEVSETTETKVEEVKKDIPEDSKDEGEKIEKKEEVKQVEQKQEAEKQKSRAQERIEQLARQKIEAEKKAAELEKRLAEKENKILDPIPKYTADELESMIPKWKDEGRDDLVTDALQAIAIKHKIEAEKWKPKAETQKKFEEEWRMTSEQMMAEDDAKPDGERLGLSDANSPITKLANAYIQDERYAPFFLSRADGIKMAVEVAKMKIKSDSVESLQKENHSLKEELKKLRGAVSLDDTPVPKESSRKEKSFDDMSPKEQEAYFRREFREMDKRNATLSLA